MKTLLVIAALLVLIPEAPAFAAGSRDQESTLSAHRPGKARRHHSRRKHHKRGHQKTPPHVR